MRAGRLQNAFSETEVLRNEMLSAGEKMLAALRAESEFFRIDPDDETVEMRRQYQQCKTIVDQCSADYARAMARWLRSVEEAEYETRDAHNRLASVRTEN